MRNAQGAILLQLRDDISTIADPGCWAVPGGGQEPGESYEAAARREMFEETGYVVGDLTLVYERDLARGNGRVEHQVFFVTDYDGVQPLACHEGQAIDFKSLAEACSLELTPDLGAVLQRVLARG